MFVNETKTNLREWKDIKVVKLVNFMTKIICLNPPKFLSSGKNKVLYSIYFCLFWIIEFLANYHELFIRRYIFYSVMATSMVILEAGFHVCLVIANFSASMDFIIFRRNSKLKITAMLDNIEMHCFRHLVISIKYDERKITRIFITIMTLVLGCIILTTAYMVSIFRNIFSYYSMMSSNIFYISLLSFQLYLDLFRLEHLLKVMNNYMEDCMTGGCAIWTVSAIKPRKSNFKRFVDVYSEILEVFERMNGLYGFHFLTIILNVAVMVLHFSSFSLKVLVNKSGPINVFTLITDAFLIASFTVSIPSVTLTITILTGDILGPNKKYY